MSVAHQSPAPPATATAGEPLCTLPGATTGATPTDGMCVLASGSSGNCTIVRITLAGAARHYLIDIGLSPRRTRRELARLGLELDQIEAVLLTHLDGDHCHSGWCGWRQKMPSSVEVFIPKGHMGRSRRMGLRVARMCPFAGAFRTPSGIGVGALMAAHDDLGAAVFRLDTPSGRLGFATDVGRITNELVEHLQGVDVLAIESNYCRQMELSSGRPRVLIDRIMGGRGHLSNLDAIEAIQRIQPRDHVVLLHLSRHCNCPHLVRSLHEKLGRPFTIAPHAQPTGWIRLQNRCEVALRPRMVEMLLFN